MGTVKVARSGGSKPPRTELRPTPGYARRRQPRLLRVPAIRPLPGPHYPERVRPHLHRSSSKPPGSTPAGLNDIHPLGQGNAVYLALPGSFIPNPSRSVRNQAEWDMLLQLAADHQERTGIPPSGAIVIPAHQHQQDEDPPP